MTADLSDIEDPAEGTGGVGGLPPRLGGGSPQRKRRSRPDAGGEHADAKVSRSSGGTNPLLGIVGGAVGGLIGAAIWAAIVYFTEHEIGWVAWGIGGLVGVGVKVASGGESSTLSGIIAVPVALASVGLGKFLSVYFLIWHLGGVAPPIDAVVQFLPNVLGPLDLLWVGLAGFTAYRVASGGDDE